MPAKHRMAGSVGLVAHRRKVKSCRCCSTWVCTERSRQAGANYPPQQRVMIPCRLQAIKERAPRDLQHLAARRQGFGEDGAIAAAA